MWKKSAIILVAALCVSSPAWSLDATVQAMTPAGTVPPGSSPNVEMLVSTAEDIGALQFMIEYNSAAATFDSVQLGSDLAGIFAITNVRENLPGVLDPAPGTDSNVLVQLVGSGTSSFTGDSKQVAVLTFQMTNSDCATSVIELKPVCQYTHLSTINLQTICSPSLLSGSLETDCVSDTAVPQGKMQLLQNVPNPFNPSTTISFEIAEAGPVHLKVYDVRGQLVRTLLNGPRQSGLQSVVWDGKDNDGRVLAAGAYFYQLISAEGTATRRTLLLK